MKKKGLLITFLFILLIIQLTAGFSRDDVRYSLKKAIFLYIQDPGIAPLTLNETKDLLFFYLVTPRIETVDLSLVRGQNSGMTIQAIIEKANRNISKCYVGWKCKSSTEIGYQYENCKWDKISICQYGCAKNQCVTPMKNVTPTPSVTPSVPDVTPSPSVTPWVQNATSPIQNFTTPVQNATPPVQNITPPIQNITPSEDIAYYVSTDGSDENVGSIDKPFKTLEKARDTIRALKAVGKLNASAHVFIRQGTYFLNQTFVLSVEDSGTKEYPITYESYPRETATISGGKKLDAKWTLYKGNIYTTNVGNLRFNSLFVNGKRAIRARTPNQGQGWYATVLPLYRWWNPRSGGHFYTVSEQEKDNIEKYPDFIYEGVQSYVYTGQFLNTVPVYRFFNNVKGVHFYTANLSERDLYAANKDWTWEGVAFSVFANSEPGTTALYKFFNLNTGSSFYTTSTAERDKLFGYAIWKYIGIEGYVFPKEQGLDSETTRQDSYHAFYFRKGDINPNWTTAEVVSFRRWFQSRLYIDRIAGNKAYVSSTSVEPFGWDYGGFDRYYVENVLDALDSPGEWFLDKTNGNLYYYPLPGENIQTSEFVAPVLKQLLQVGDYEKVKEYTNGDYAYITEGGSLDFAYSNFSVSVWLRFPVGSKNPSWSLAKGSPFFIKGYGIAHFSESNPVNPVEFVINDGITKVHSSAGSLNRGEWGHFVWNIDRTQGIITAYKNGVMVGQTSIAGLGDISMPTVPLFVGRVAETTYYSGDMDELKIFKKVISSSEVQNLYTSNTANPTNLALSLSFEDNYLDASPQRNNGLIEGIPSFVDGRFGKSSRFSARTISGSTPFTDYVKFVNFRNLKFEDADWGISAAGYIGSQTAYDSSAPAIMFISENCTFENNQVSHVGGYGLSSYSRNLKITGNEFYDTGAGAVRIGQPFIAFFVTHDQYDMMDNLAGSNVIQDNLIHDTGKVFKEAVGLAIYGNSNNMVSNNLFYNITYTGISLGWFSALHMGDMFGGNMIRFNDIHNVMTEMNDGAGIYIMGKQAGTVISNNVIHDVVKTQNHLDNMYFWGIYTEGGTADLTIEKNLVYRTGWGGLMFFTNLGGTNNKNNTARNNIFIDGSMYQTFLEDAAQDYFYNNIIYYTTNGAMFATIGPNSIKYSDNNLFYSPTNLAGLNSQLSLWRAYGYDKNSLVEDPLFVDYNRDNFNLQANSPAYTKLGFKPIDYGSFGPKR